MEALFRRHLWVVDLIGIGLGGALVGHAFALLIISAWPTAASTPARGRATPRSPPATVSTGTKSVDGIVARNVFCSTCDASGPRPEPTRLPFKLLAIMFAPPPLTMATEAEAPIRLAPPLLFRRAGGGRWKLCFDGTCGWST